MKSLFFTLLVGYQLGLAVSGYFCFYLYFSRFISNRLTAKAATLVHGMIGIPALVAAPIYVLKTYEGFSGLENGILFFIVSVGMTLAGGWAMTRIAALQNNSEPTEDRKRLVPPPRKPVPFSASIALPSVIACISLVVIWIADSEHTHKSSPVAISLAMILLPFAVAPVIKAVIHSFLLNRSNLNPLVTVTYHFIGSAICYLISFLVLVVLFSKTVFDHSLGGAIPLLVGALFAYLFAQNRKAI